MTEPAESTARIVPLDVGADRELATRLLELQQDAYAVEAALTGDDRIPALREGLGDLQVAPVRWFGCFGPANGSGSATELQGAIAWTTNDYGVDIDRLVVRPDRFRRGVGSELVAALLAEAAGRPVTASTGRGNEPAAALYRKHGFVQVGDIEVVPNFWVSQFTRPANTAT